MRQLLGSANSEQGRIEPSYSRAPTRHDVAFSIASFSGTPVATIRAAIAESDAILAPSPQPTNRGARRAMLIGQASINLTANIFSALLGLFSVFIFTRLFSPHDYGVYLLGVGFASVISVFLVGWFRNLILSGHARNDGTDVRGLVISGYLICCLTAPDRLRPGTAGRIGHDGGIGCGRAFRSRSACSS